MKSKKKQVSKKKTAPKKVKPAKLVPQKYYFTSFHWVGSGQSGYLSNVHSFPVNSTFNILQVSSKTSEYLESLGLRNVVSVLQGFQSITQAEYILYIEETKAAHLAEAEDRKIREQAAAVKAEADRILAEANKTREDKADAPMSEADSMEDMDTSGQGEVIPMRAESNESIEADL